MRKIKFRYKKDKTSKIFPLKEEQYDKEKSELIPINGESVTIRVFCTSDGKNFCNKISKN